MYGFKNKHGYFYGILKVELHFSGLKGMPFISHLSREKVCVCVCARMCVYKRTSYNFRSNLIQLHFVEVRMYSMLKFTELLSSYHT